MIVDDFSPTAIEERDTAVRVFFSSAADRDAAGAALASHFDVAPLDVPDEDWARRSQEGLTPITVGRMTVAPPWTSPSLSPQPSALVVTILPSMGFGTGHHATTRLCLAAMQATGTVDMTGAVLLDVGTGSGILAIAGALLGAARAVGIDVDPDAVQSARDNLILNPGARHVNFEVADLTSAALPQAGVLTANLTGALLVKSAPLLLAATRPGGVLILSGLQAHERDEVCRAFAPAALCWEREEDGWVGLALEKTTRP